MQKTGRHAAVKLSTLAKVRNAASFGAIGVVATLASVASTLLAPYVSKEDDRRYLDAV